MNYLHVFYSNKGKYFDFIKKYKKESNCIKFYCIEDAINSNLSFFERDTVYLLLNDLEMINKFINKYKGKVRILNQNFYEMKLSKLDVQNLLYKHSYNVPKIMDKNDFDKCYFKENNHQGFSQVINSAFEAKQVIKTNKVKSFYLEEYISFDREIKLYYVFDKLYSKDIECLDSDKYKDIAKILSLDIMSIDILIKDDIYYLIDVNASPGLYHCDEGLTYFIKRVIL